jgi:manganese/zinc/iron transport system permease protein
MSSEAWVLVIAALVAISTSLVGCFLVLRRLSMLGDAISHSILFGIVVAFLATGSRGIVPMFIGAVVLGLLTTFLTSLLHRWGKLQEDASVGVVFTFLFAAGVILISLYAGKVDLDQECVLFGEIAFAPFDTLQIGHLDVGPRSFWALLLSTILNGAFLLISFRRLQAISFDPILSYTTGLWITGWHYILMTLVSITTVAAFDAVGAVLVVGLLVIPPATALLIARSIQGMIGYSLTFSLLSVGGGFELARLYDSSISAAMIVVAGVLFLLILSGSKWMERTRRRQETATLKEAEMLRDSR